MPLKRANAKKTGNQPKLVIAIGASAGSVRVLKILFSKLRNIKGDVAFIVIQHLDEAGRKIAAETLKSFSPLPIKEIQKGVKLQSNHVYWVPPHTTVSLDKYVFKTSVARTTDQKLSVINNIFNSVGKEFGSDSVGVLLSGDANDGAQGIKDINEAGGLTIVQDPESAEHKSMPESAIATGAVDHILKPDQIPDAIEKNAKYLSKLNNQLNESVLQEQIVAALTTICDILQRHTQQDFKHYKNSTLLRRIQRRMQVLRIDSVEGYIDRLAASKDEAHDLYNELLINVTSFFRDPKAFDVLKSDVLEKLIKERKPDQKIRIWIPGCSTGQEPYTMAILLHELIEKLKSKPEIQIIATDIDHAALEIARKGSYPATIAEHVSQARLAKYFTKRGGRYHVNKELREMCLFSLHNLINDPPFSQLDLISCRNLLIYLGSHLQKKLFAVFHYALKPHGYLFLGASESFTSHKELFKTIDSKLRIAQRKTTAIKAPTGIPNSINNYLSNFQESTKTSETDIGLIGQRIALDEMPLKYAVCNDDGHILSSSAGINKYVEIPEGPFQNNIIKLVKPNIRPVLRKAFALAKREKRKVVDESCAITTESDVERLGIIVQPMPQLGVESSLYWVAFQYLGRVQKAEPQAARVSTEADSELIDQLEREVFVLREDLDKTVQDLEASNEELKSSNEELLSMNEELQSANEELETSKEEIQIANESLQRVNADLENLLSGTQIATLFLDDDLKIRGFTPAITKVYRIQSSDIGRDIRDFTSHTNSFEPFPDPKTLTSDKILESEVLMADGSIYQRRVLPYKNHDNVHEGIVVTYIDVTTVRLAEQRYRELADSMPNIVWTATPDGSTDYFNEQWYRFTGFDRKAMGHEGWLPILHPDDKQRTAQTWQTSIATGQPFEIEYRFWDRASSSFRWYLGRGVPIKRCNGKTAKWVGTSTDIHEQKISRQLLEENQKSLELMIRTSPSFMCVLRGPNYIFETVNEKYLQLVGHRDVIGKPIAQALPEVVDQGFVQLLEGVRNTGEPYVGTEVPVYLQRRPGLPLEKRYLDFVYQAHGTTNDEIDRIFVHGVDVTEKVNSRIHIENERENFRNLFRQTPEMVCILSGPDHLFEFVNEAHIRVLGFDATGKTVREAQPESIEVHGILDDVYRTGKTAELHEIPVTVTNRLRHFNLTYSARYNIDGEIDGIMILGTEVTQEVANRGELRKAKQDAEFANESKTRFLANMSHEIRTPLAAIVGFSDLLRGRLTNDVDANTYIDRISRNAGLLGRLIDELLDLSKIEADKLKIEKALIDVDSLIEDVFSTIHLRAEDKGLELKFTWLTPKPKSIVTDPVRLAQILTNIIGNAVKFTERGHVAVDFAVQDSKLIVTVSDTGIGLSLEQQKRIFEPFMQADNSVTRKFGGTGLGLALSKKLAQLLGGDLKLIRSNTEEGSVFELALKIDEQPDVIFKKQEISCTDLGPDTLKGKRILVVDDAPDNRTIVGLFLRSIGAETIEAVNGLEGYEKAQSEDLDLILMDIQMPIMDGYQSVAKIKRAGITTPVFALTAHALKEERERCLVSGFSGYITKPINRVTLLRSVCDIILKAKNS